MYLLIGGDQIERPRCDAVFNPSGRCGQVSNRTSASANTLNVRSWACAPTLWRQMLNKNAWIVECDDQELKQELGLGHQEEGGWRGFQHHATLCIAV